MASQDELKVVTKKVRLGYPSLFEAKANKPTDAPKFSVEILIPKTDTVTIEKIIAAQNLAARSERGKKVFGDNPPTYGSPKLSKKIVNTLRDGDDPDENDGHPERTGHWFMGARAQATRKPGVVGPDRQPVTDESMVYGGVFARVSMSAFPFDNDGAKGVSFGLNSVQVLGYGEPFGAPRENAEEVFDDDFEDDGAGSEESDDLL